jgi:hypothetical protein
VFRADVLAALGMPPFQAFDAKALAEPSLVIAEAAAGASMRRE